MKVDRLALGEVDSRRRIAARVRPPGGEEFELWFAVPPDFGGDDPDATPFLVALLPWAMKAGEPFELDGTVSPRLLDAMDDAQRVYRSFYPDTMSPISVRPVGTAVPDPGPRITTAFFSRGLDSWYTVLAERDAPSAPPLTHLIHIDGIDVNYDEEQKRLEREAVEQCAEIAGLELTECATNLRRHTDSVLDWNPCHGAGLSALALCLRPERSLTPSGYAFGEMMPAGSRFDLDHRFSTEHTSIAVHGEATRAEKAEALARWPEALALLNVCFSGNLRRNCGDCSKCVHTMLELHAAGVDPRTAGFDRPLTPARLASTAFHPAGEGRYRETLARLRESPGNEALADAFSIAILRGRAELLADAFSDRNGSSEKARGKVESALALLEDETVAPRRESRDGLIGLIRAVDHRSGRHVYGYGYVPEDAAVAGELGALEAFRQEDSTPVWVIDGRLTSQAGGEPAVTRPSLAHRARFVVAPLAWSGDLAGRSRVAALARRAALLTRGARRAGTAPYEGEPVPLGYLHSQPADGRLPLYSALHPVAGDQLLTTSPLEASDMGYGAAELLGYMLERAPVSGRLGVRERPPVPWASRLGQSARL